MEAFVPQYKPTARAADYNIVTGESGGQLAPLHCGGHARRSFSPAAKGSNAVADLFQSRGSQTARIASSGPPQSDFIPRFKPRLKSQGYNIVSGESIERPRTSDGLPSLWKNKNKNGGDKQFGRFDPSLYQWYENRFGANQCRSFDGASGPKPHKAMQQYKFRAWDDESKKTPPKQTDSESDVTNWAHKNFRAGSPAEFGASFTAPFGLTDPSTPLTPLSELSRKKYRERKQASRAKLVSKMERAMTLGYIERPASVCGKPSEYYPEPIRAQSVIGFAHDDHEDDDTFPAVDSGFESDELITHYVMPDNHDDEWRKPSVRSLRSISTPHLARVRRSNSPVQSSPLSPTGRNMKNKQREFSESEREQKLTEARARALKSSGIIGGAPTPPPRLRLNQNITSSIFNRRRDKHV